MRKFAILLAAIGVLVPAAFTVPAAAASRTFVSGTGTDGSGNTCPRTNPCATFGYALTQTDVGGEIDCLNAGDYSQPSVLTINFAVTISCEAGTASSGPVVMFINAPPTDDVTLRGLNFNGFVGGDVGIVIVKARTVHIENCAFRGFRFASNSAGIRTSASSANTIFIYVTDSVFSDNSNGVSLLSSGGYKIASLKNVTITGQTGDGVLAQNAGVFVNITGSMISGNGGNAVSVLAGGSEVNIDRSTLANNTTALLAGASGATIRAIGNNIFSNTYAFAIASGATLATDGQNRTSGNVNNQTANASVTLQ